MEIRRSQLPGPELQKEVSGDLTVLLQGAVNAANIDHVLQSIAMWRQAYPGAALHFCASTLGEAIDEGASSVRRPEKRNEEVRQRELLISQVSTVVDHFSVASYQSALPTLKFDSGPNNCNRMIAAAKRGLKNVTSRFVLRCRYDLFIDDITACLNDYALLDRKGIQPDLFDWPIAISPYFTLNPLLLEKLPYHVSDWFHFGLTSDVKALWDVDFFSARDAQYYQMYPHAAHSGQIEKMFRARLSPEQYLFNSVAVKKGYPALRYHNEPGHEGCFFDLLRRNFVVVDHRAVGMTFQKYDRVKDWLQSDYQSINHEQWSELVRLGPAAWRRRLWGKRLVVAYYRNCRPRHLYRKWKRSRIVRTAWWLR